MAHINEDMIISYIYKETNEQENMNIEKHTATCAECAKCIAEMRETLAVIDEQSQPEMAAETTQELCALFSEPDKKQEQSVNEIFTVEELAAFLKVPAADIYELLNDIPYITIAGRIRFRKSSIEKWLELQEHNSMSEHENKVYEEIPLKLWRDAI